MCARLDDYDATEAPKSEKINKCVNEYVCVLNDEEEKCTGFNGAQIIGTCNSLSL